jgi:hypothetical protein
MPHFKMPKNHFQIKPITTHLCRILIFLMIIMYSLFKLILVSGNNLGCLFQIVELQRTNYMAHLK